MHSHGSLALFRVLFVFFNIRSAHGAPGLLDFIGHIVQGTGLPLLDRPLPEMMTKTPSPECVNINKGTRLCCQSTFNGDVPLLIELAPVIGYTLNKSVNGIYCELSCEIL
jgi:hypothetical protein